MSTKDLDHLDSSLINHWAKKICVVCRQLNDKDIIKQQIVENKFIIQIILY